MEFIECSHFKSFTYLVNLYVMLLVQQKMIIKLDFIIVSTKFLFID
jgi:hypothetical protein